MAPRPRKAHVGAASEDAGPSGAAGVRKRRRRSMVSSLEEIPIFEVIGPNPEMLNILISRYRARQFLQVARETALPEVGNLPKPFVEGPLPLDAAEKDAEDFDIDTENRLFTQAQQEASDAAEAEYWERFVDEYEADLATLADCDNIENQHLKTALQKGAEYQVTGIPENATYDELVSLQYAAERLLHMCSTAKEELLADERIRRMEVEHTLKRQLDELSSLQALQAAEMHKLQESVEEHRDRAICTICFSNVRDTLLLPCMHFHFCSICVARHLKDWKTCPICRTPVNGTLETKWK